MFHDNFVRARRALLVLLFLSGALSARASDHRFASDASPDGAAYREECGSCHLAFPPQLLGAQGWQRIMSGLDRHFGTDASLEPARAARIAAYLRGNAGASRRFGGAALRISETAWFREEHDDVSAATWRSPAVRTPANCQACHTQAERGDFSERNISLPKEARR